MELICFLCHKNCTIRTIDKDHVLGAACKRGENFAVAEVVDPQRTVIGTVKTIFKGTPALSVKTDGKISKEQVFPVMELLRGITVKKYKKIGDVIVENVLGSGVNVVATMDMRRNER